MKRIRSRTTALAATLAFAFPPPSAALFAQSAAAPAPVAPAPTSGVIEGRVKNAATGDYLGNARVILVGTREVAFTSPTGTFRFSAVPAGRATVRVSFTSLEEQTVEIEVVASQTSRHDFALVHSSDGPTIRLDAVSVAATREMNASALAINEQRYAPNLKNVIAADAFGDVSEGNLGEFVKRLPGVTVNAAAGDANNITLRGFSGSFTPISVDGDRMPSASTSATAASRMTNLETLSISNVSRVEVIKSPIPSVWADSLGGAVNLISKTAFERSRPELSVRALVQFTGEELSPGSTPSPGGTQSHKVRPGYELSYINPVSDTFGFTLSALRSDQFGRLRTANGTWEYTAAAGGSETNPYYRAGGINDDPRITVRDTYSLGADWRPLPSLTLSANYQNSRYDLFTAPTRISFNAGTLPTSYGSDFTQGRAGAGTVAYAPIWASKFGDTDKFRLGAKAQWGDWKVDFSGSYAFSKNKYRDTSEGFFRGVTTRMVTPTVRFAQVSTPGAPGTIEVRNNTTGALTDWTQLANHQMLTATSAVRDAKNDLGSARLDLRREFDLGRLPAALQVGGAIQRQLLDWSALEQSWNFLGADGRAATTGSTDDSAGVILDTDYVGYNPGYRWPSTIQWPDMKKLYQLYQQHPEYFSLDSTAAFINGATNSERIEEVLSAAYVQGELRLLNNRLWLVGGVRFERTEDEGTGLKRDRNAIYQRDAAGNLVRDAAGQPILRTSDALQQAKLQYISRGLTSSRSYDDLYPSVNASYTFTDNLTLRLGYARTVGRPDFVNVVPNIDINETATPIAGQPGGTVTVRNTGLRPWTSDGYDLSLEYYFNPSGVLSAGVFRKDVTDAFASVNTILDDAKLQELGLSSAYRDWTLVTKFNVAVPVRITGYEFNWQQTLAMLPPWARGFSVFANATLLHIDGPDVDYGSLLKRSYNWGLSYARGRVSAGLAWNLIGAQKAGTPTFGADAVTFSPRTLRLDGNLEVRLTKQLGLFFNGRNINNPSIGNVSYSSRSPDYARQPSATISGIKFSAGLRGTF